MKTPDEITINEKSLTDILELHRKWTMGEAEGNRANMSDADLGGAYLSGADLSGADLSDANLSGADMSDADLGGAYLGGAYLRGANLRGADLSGANLSGANLSGADLSGAYLSGADLSGADGIIAIGPIGSRGDFIFGIRHEKTIMIKTGCFWGTLAEFKKQVKATHKENEHAQAYEAAIVFIRKYFAVKGK
jgi:hypothetical protein